MKKDNSVGLTGLIALTVSSVVGGGIFNLMSDMAKVASVGPVTIALIISGIGMGIFVMCLQNLNEKLPHLDAGIYSYAEEGFGSFVGFLCALGYWLSIFLGNVALGSLAFSALSYFFPVFENGQNIYSVIGASVLLWAMHFLILRGSNFASKINGFITIAKLIPLGIFIICLMVGFKYDLFTQDVWGTITGNFNWSEVMIQVKKSMTYAVWVFVGVEGAIVYSARAKNKKIVGKATILSFTIITSIYLLSTVLSFAVLSQSELAVLSKPAMAQVLESVVGRWGAILINGGVVISATGAWFACTMFAGEILFQGAKDHIFPKFLSKENKNGAPVSGLLISNILVQFFFLSLLINSSAYNFMALLASSTMLIPYFFVSLSQLRLSWKWENKKITRNVILGAISSIYMGYCLYASGFEYLFVTSLLFAPGLLLFIKARKEGDKLLFTKVEKVFAILLTVSALAAVVLIILGNIDISSM
ncbi:amino acid permease [Vagococcus sp. DIV0080]|uniref:Amino acid permease n=1 Tax=Candidatus Vagococcus giribetii TaxID=2230876 RepID=A0ABS3HQM4_9ENTE|nr:basic amino acid/polyamine antiporter [Vagococcus sp. DIV0080]MBO0476054.1 amino acid permease [Vagococcus sp. DIV0080]